MGIGDILVESETFTIIMSANRHKSRYVHVSPALMEIIADYIHLDRRAIVVSGECKRPGWQHASSQSLRSRFLTRLVECFLTLQEGTGKPISYRMVLLKASQAAGYADPESLSPYLEYVLAKRIVTATGKKKPGCSPAA
jgi:hypothetical protein